ncbi:MAG: hypothetical protein US58_C0025G0004 [Candidatus Magasanikbacteria bacterium GW2011_GWA2_37_8]|uniref:Aspartate racemase n=1 Tax=Candidatus Magasanikbacteria bacterium GW2011_GWA2_37_8 TaxID=1619036 RepID=A0A0G0HMY6_9BACT|nr:MAG: hypothetical protein US58_C0025G0004 [Candidatus Magasanikbacteria bacterium GW2011_GWA2_37_8]
MKTVGIIGGVGPETTSEFYLDIVFSCQKKTKANVVENFTKFYDFVKEQV